MPGFSLFRRTSSAVANPTTQGVTLRGLSASGASRTLVVADEVPLNDPFGGWVYWDRIPLAALQRVDVLRGASGDIHGNDALGGVIRLTTRTRQRRGGVARRRFVGHRRARPVMAGCRERRHERRRALPKADDGRLRGRRAGSPRHRSTWKPIRAGTSTIGWLGGTRGTFQAIARGGYFDENRGNGTPAQLNTTITRWGGANAHGRARRRRLGGARRCRALTNYHQTFSAVLAGRATERLTALQWVVRGGGAGVSWLRQAARGAGAVRASAAASRAPTSTKRRSRSPASRRRSSARARSSAATGSSARAASTVTPRVTLDAGVRADYWRLEEARQHRSGVTNLKLLLEPRVGASFQLTPDSTLRVSWLTGFRTPTMNELYRGVSRRQHATTLANAKLDPEKSLGPEVAFTMRRDRWTGARDCLRDAA